MRESGTCPERSQAQTGLFLEQAQSTPRAEKTLWESNTINVISRTILVMSALNLIQNTDLPQTEARWRSFVQLFLWQTCDVQLPERFADSVVCNGLRESRIYFPFEGHDRWTNLWFGRPTCNREYMVYKSIEWWLIANRNANWSTWTSSWERACSKSTSAIFSNALSSASSTSFSAIVVNASRSNAFWLRPATEHFNPLQTLEASRESETSFEDECSPLVSLLHLFRLSQRFLNEMKSSA